MDGNTFVIQDTSRNRFRISETSIDFVFYKENQIPYPGGLKYYIDLYDRPIVGSLIESYLCSLLNWRCFSAVAKISFFNSSDGE